MKQLFIIIGILLSTSIFSKEILEMIESEDLNTKKLGVMKAAKKKELEPKVIEIFKNKDSNLELRIIAARTLAVYKTDNSLNALIEESNSKSEDLQTSIIRSLIKFKKNEKAINTIIKLLKNGKTEFVRSSAAQTLGEVKNNSSVVDALIFALDDDSVLVRKKAANSLGEIKDKKAIPALKKAHKDAENKDLKSYIFSALKKMDAVKINKKSTTTALLLGITPVNGLGTWYAGNKILAISNVVIEAAAIGMMVYGFSGFNERDEDLKYKEPAKHWLFITGLSLFTAGYVLDIVYPIISVNNYNKRQENKTSYRITPMFFSDGKTTVAGININF